MTSATCADDGRRQLVQLTESGRALLAQILPMWDAILLAMEEIINAEPACKELLSSIGALEQAFKSTNLAEKIGDKFSVKFKIWGK